MSAFLQEQREKGLAFVPEELERFKHEGKSDSAFRYAHLLEYYAIRSGNHIEDNQMRES